MTAPRATLGAALAWLSHPVTCVAVAVLLVNDHVLKAAFGSWWTGKLSDVAGLVVAPPLLALASAALHAGVSRWRPIAAPDPVRLAVGSVAVVGLGFVVVKTTHGGAAATTAVWSMFDGPGLVRLDPTDLLALPALLLAVWVAGRVDPRARDVARARAGRVPARWLVVLPVAVLATVATTEGTFEYGAEHVGVVDGVLIVEDANGNLFRSLDGTTWDEVDGQPEVEEALALALHPESAADSTAEPDDVVCLAEWRRECYRPAQRLDVGVARSLDAGQTWAVDWALSAESVDALAERVDPHPRPWTHQVALFRTADGTRVYAANGTAGLAVRDEDGRWELLGFPYDPAPPEPFDSTGDRRLVFPYPWPLVLGLAVVFVVVLGAGRRPGWRGSSGIALLAGSAVALIPATAAVIAATDWRAGVVMGFFSGVTMSVLVPVAVGLLVGGALASGRGVALAPVDEPVVAILLAIGALAGGIVLARRLVSTSPPPDDEPPLLGPIRSRELSPLGRPPGEDRV